MFNQYKEYKKLNKGWITSMPKHWKVSKLKWLTTIYSGGTPDTTNDDYWENGDIPWLNSGTVNQGFITEPSHLITESAVLNSSAKWVPKDALVMALAGQGKTKGTVAILGINATCNQSMAAIVPNEQDVNNKFLFFWLDSNYKRIRGLAGTELRDGLNLQIIGNINCPLPPMNEQIIIANYLSNFVESVGVVIRKRLKLLSLLKEKKEAIINEAITTGFNQESEYENYDHDWLTRLPGNWNLKNLKFVAKHNQYSFTGGPFGSDLKNSDHTEMGVRIIQLQNIGIGDFKNHYKIFTSQEKADELSSCNVFPGDIIIAKMADPVARACIVPNFDDRYLMASDGIRLEVNTNLYNVKFVEYALNSKYFRHQAELNSSGSTRLRIGLSTLKKLKIAAPSLVEQDRIVEKLNYIVSNIDINLEKVIMQIEKLKEYQNSFVSEAVSGQFDLRNVPSINFTKS